MFFAAPWLEGYARRAHRKLGFPAEKIGISLPPRPTPRAVATPTPQIITVPEPEPTTEPPLPEESRPALIRIPRQELRTAQLWNGIIANHTLELAEGGLASEERLRDQSYVMNFLFINTVPTAASTLEELLRTSSKLHEVLPGLESMMESARVSRYFDLLYEEKIKNNRSNLSILSQLVSRHNFYDCQTILKLRHPKTGRRVTLIQADMDVVTDGTDPERTLEYDTTSPSFQPITTYGWARTSRAPENPLIPQYRQLIKDRETELNTPGTTDERKRALRSSIDYLRRLIADLQARSFLVAQNDPFIVIPLSMRGTGAPQIGDYAAVIHENRVFPAIVGEYGPAAKIGEASLRICREIDPTVSGLRRAVSDLSVTYLIFNDTVEKPHRRPNLDHWHNMVQKYLDEVGGISVQLHKFEDTLSKPTPSPTPELTPELTPEPTPTLTLELTPEPATNETLVEDPKSRLESF